jgi:hypothetical protein
LCAAWWRKKHRSPPPTTTVRELRAWIEREIHLDLTNAPFDPQDETLLPKAGACTRCPKRSGSNPLLFPEVGQKSI